MIEKLSQEEFHRALPLVEGEPLTYFAVVARAMAEGNTSGRIWVDSRERPGAMLMWDGGHVYGLGGSPGSDGTVGALAQLVAGEIFPQALAGGYSNLKLYYSPVWESRVEAVFTGASPVQRERVLFTLDELALPDWRSSVPEGCSVQLVDAAFLDREDLKNLDSVREEIACCWASLAHFLDKGFGFCMVVGDEIACWCMAEYASGSDRGIGIETVERYRSRGFATITACAFVEHCLANGLRPYWDAWQSNVPSVATAKRVGFEKVSDYSVFLGTIGSDR